MKAIFHRDRDLNEFFKNVGQSFLSIDRRDRQYVGEIREQRARLQSSKENRLTLSVILDRSDEELGKIRNLSEKYKKIVINSLEDFRSGLVKLKNHIENKNIFITIWRLFISVFGYRYREKTVEKIENLIRKITFESEVIEKQLVPRKVKKVSFDESLSLRTIVGDPAHSLLQLKSVQTSIQKANSYQAQIVQFLHAKVHESSLLAEDESVITPLPTQMSNPVESPKCVSFQAVSPKAPERRYPPASFNDTVYFMFDSTGGLIPASVHGQGYSIKDASILEKHIPTHRLLLKDGKSRELEVLYGPRGEAILLQQASRGCTAAVTAMLLLDRGLMPDIYKLAVRNLGNDASMIHDLIQGGISKDDILFTNLEGERIQLLHCFKEALIRYGSAICTLDTGIGGHVVVVDDVDIERGRVVLRDPYHGWQIEVSTSYFLENIFSPRIIQISSTCPFKRINPFELWPERAISRGVWGVLRQF